MPRRKTYKQKVQKFSLFSASSFLVLIIIQVTFILFMVGQLILVQAPNINYTQEKSDAAIRFALYPQKIVKLGSLGYTLYIADTDERRILGLSGTQTMKSSEGLAFVFDQSDTHGFWMKDMLFPLDFIFVSGGVVVETLENIDPNTYPQTFAPSVPVDTVIELNAGQVSLNGIAIGDFVDLL